MSEIVKITGIVITGICIIASIAVYPDPKLWGSLIAILAGILGIPPLVSRYDKRHSG